jgi:hypothetical protein
MWLKVSLNVREVFISILGGKLLVMTSAEVQICIGERDVDFCKPNYELLFVVICM